MSPKSPLESITITSAVDFAKEVGLDAMDIELPNPIEATQQALDDLKRSLHGQEQRKQRELAEAFIRTNEKQEAENALERLATGIGDRALKNPKILAAGAGVAAAATTAIVALDKQIEGVTGEKLGLLDTFRNWIKEAIDSLENGSIWKTPLSLLYKFIGGDAGASNPSLLASPDTVSEQKNTAGDYAYLQKGKTLLSLRAGEETSKKTRSIAESFMRDASFQKMSFSELQKLSQLKGEQRYTDSKVKEIFSHSQSSDAENREAFDFLLYAFFDKSTAVGREISSIFTKNSDGKTVRQAVGAVGAELNFFAGIGDLDISELASGNVGDKLTSIRYNTERKELEGPAVDSLSEKYPLPVLTYMLHSGANMRIPTNTSEVQKFLTTKSDTFFPKDKQHIEKIGELLNFGIGIRDSLMQNQTYTLGGEYSQAVQSALSENLTFSDIIQLKYLLGDTTDFSGLNAFQKMALYTFIGSRIPDKSNQAGYFTRLAEDSVYVPDEVKAIMKEVGIAAGKKTVNFFEHIASYWWGTTKENPVAGIGSILAVALGRFFPAANRSGAGVVSDWFSLK